jgi:hypothetical protein
VDVAMEIVVDMGAADGRHFRCPSAGCEYAASQRRYLSRHLRTHTGYKPHKCPYPGCEYAATKGWHLKRHIAGVHTRERKHRCTHPGCDYASVRPPAMPGSLHVQSLDPSAYDGAPS